MIWVGRGGGRVESDSRESGSGKDVDLPGAKCQNGKPYFPPRKERAVKINAALPILISLLPTALSACASTAAARNDAPTVAEQPPATATPDKVGAVVRVDVPGRGNGSGVVISNDGHVLTCAHVVVGADSIRVTAEKDGRPLFFTASIVAIDRTRDLAVLLTRDREPFPVTAAFANSADIVAGHDVYGAGFPEGRGQSVANGTIRRFPFSFFF